MFITKKQISRRTMLRGAGATLALPMLDGMIPAFATAREAAAATPVKRFGAIHVGMGMDMRTWTQATPGELALNPILQPLAAFKDRMVVVG